MHTVQDDLMHTRKCHMTPRISVVRPDYDTVQGGKDQNILQKDSISYDDEHSFSSIFSNFGRICFTTNIFDIEHRTIN